MLFDEMSQIARNIASQRMSSNMPLSFNDTICVAYTCSSKIYVGVSSVQMVNNMPMAYHAEVELCNNLMNENDTAVAEISLFNASTFQPVLPCSDCIARIMGLNPNNANTLLLLPTQNVALSQMGAFLQSQNMGMPAPNMGMPMQNMGMQGQYMNPAMAAPNMGMPMQNMGMQSQYINPAMNQGMYANPAAGQGMQSQYANPAAMQSQYAAPAAQPAQSQYAASADDNANQSRYTESMYLQGDDTDDGQILKNRLNKLFSVEDEPDINDLKAQKAQEKAAQKKKFKLF